MEIFHAILPIATYPHNDYLCPRQREQDISQESPSEHMLTVIETSVQQGTNKYNGNVCLCALACSGVLVGIK